MHIHQGKRTQCLFVGTATTDYSVYLSIQPGMFSDETPYGDVFTFRMVALDFRQWLGGEQKINDYCHSLALTGGKLLSQLLGTPLLDPTGDFTLNMTNVGLPLSPDTPNDGVTHEMFIRNLLEVWRVSAAIFRHNGRWWVRVSAQVWNEVSSRRTP